MKKEIKKLPESKIEIEFEIPVEDWEAFLNEAAKELSNSLRVQGFRPGNMPRNIVEREVGSAKILERGIELAVRKTYIQTIVDDKIEAIGPPKVTVLKSAPGNPLVFKAEVVVMPEIELADYKKIAAGQKMKKEDDIIVSDEELGQSLEWLRKSRAKYITVRRGAKNGDRLEIDFSVSIDGEKIENGEAKKYPLVLGQSKFIKGFDENLIDVKEGEEKKFSLAFPDDYHDKTVAGKLADFSVKVNLIQEAELPELNNEFAKSLGSFENIEKLKENIKNGLKQEKIEKEKNDWRQSVVDKIAEKSKMEMPGLLISEEIEKMISDMKANVENFGLPWEKYLEQLDAANPEKNKTKNSEEELREKIRPQAIKRINFSLVLREIAKKEKIEITPAEIEEEMNMFLRHYQAANEAKPQFDTEGLKEYTYGVLRNKKVFERLEAF